MAIPISVRLLMICQATGQASASGLQQASPKQARPKRTPESAAMISRFVLCICPS